jgi:ubiquitin carboxyl-terminal hydrolase 12/46
MRVKRLPTILALHLKRFKYVEQYNRHIKVIKRILKLRQSFNLSIKSHA